MRKDSLGDRMKEYESVSKNHLVRRMPVIIRIDGKAFHTFTKRFKGSFDDTMHFLMTGTTKLLCDNVQNAVIGYTQSDEISILLNDWKTLETDQWFGGGVQKITSVAASMATGYFNALYRTHVNFEDMTMNEILSSTAFFDARVFNIPKEDVANYFIWRQQDASRNSVQMLGREYFSHKQLHKKSNSEIQDMLMLEHGVNWNDMDTWKKRGTCVVRDTKNIITDWKYEDGGDIVGNVKDVTFVSKKLTDVKFKQSTKTFIDEEIPIFTQDRDYIEDLL
jgi:tRNA(His) 5'-end guanylyltransferase